MKHLHFPPIAFNHGEARQCFFAGPEVRNDPVPAKEVIKPAEVQQQTPDKPKGAVQNAMARFAKAKDAAKGGVNMLTSGLKKVANVRELARKPSAEPKTTEVTGVQKTQLEAKKAPKITIELKPMSETLGPQLMDIRAQRAALREAMKNMEPGSKEENDAFNQYNELGKQEKALVTEINTQLDSIRTQRDGLKKDMEKANPGSKEENDAFNASNKLYQEEVRLYDMVKPLR